MNELEPIKPYATPESLARNVMSFAYEVEPIVIPDEIVLTGKPAAVSLLAEGYATIVAIRARDRDIDLDKASGPSLVNLSANPRSADRTRGAQLGQLIAAAPIFRGTFFSRSNLAHSTSETGTADSTLLEDINHSFRPDNPKTAKKFYAELCLVGMHAYTTRASIYSGGKSYLEGFQSIEARLAAHNSSDQQLSEGLKRSRPEDITELETYFESVLGLSSLAISLMTDRTALIKRHESLPARIRRRLLKSAS